MSTSIIVRVLITLYLVLLLLFQWLVTWLLQVIFMIVSYPFITSERRSDICGLIFHRMTFVCMDVLNPFWNSTIIRPFPGVKAKKFLVMMNHLSNADPFLSVRPTLSFDCTWVAKDELFYIPFGGWCMSNAGELKVCFVDKKKGFETIKGTVGVMMEEARKILRRGRPIAVFPEGIRNKNPEGGLLPFRLGFFTLAVEEGATVVPLCISGTENCWPRGSALMDKANPYFSWGDPIDASKFKTAEELRDHVWQALTDIRESLPDRLERKSGKKNK